LLIFTSESSFSAAGLFFCPGPRSHAGMDKSIERIIRRVLEEARAKGRDHITQTELAVRAVCEARPDMTASDALTAMEMVRRLLSRNQMVF
jgi:hypothetical protein